MFLDRLKDADEAYLKHRGQEVGNAEGKIFFWEMGKGDRGRP